MGTGAFACGAKRRSSFPGSVVLCVKKKARSDPRLLKPIRQAALPPRVRNSFSEGPMQWMSLNVKRFADRGTCEISALFRVSKLEVTAIGSQPAAEHLVFRPPSTRFQSTPRALDRFLILVLMGSENESPIRSFGGLCFGNQFFCN